MAQIHVYLTFDGQCEEAFRLYSKAFGKEPVYIGRFAAMPPSDELGELSEEDQRRIMHICLPIEENFALMGSDQLTQHPPLVKGTNMSASINVNSREEADQLFTSLSEGGTITMPMSDTFWGAYFGMFTDRFGVQWMINYDPQPV